MKKKKVNIEFKSCALRTRDNPKCHHLEIRKDKLANALTNVCKDSLVVILKGKK